MRTAHRAALTAFTLVLFAACVTGCSTTFVPDAENTGQVAFGPVSGIVHGGQSPLINTRVYAYETGISGYGGASKSLLGATDTGGYPTLSDGTSYYVTTDSQGYFQISAATTCDTNRVVYLYSGNVSAFTPAPSGSNTNTSVGLMAILGTCPASGLLINAITTGTSAQIYMNEVSTVAAAYALAGFATTATAISNSGTTLGNTGIQNAAANASQMYTTIATADGGTANNGSTRTALATTPNGNGTVPQQTLDTLANILAACVNTSSIGSTPCHNLFNDIKSAGTTGTSATDTATAAIYIAHNPTANVTALYNLVGSTANPFNPALTSGAPATWNIELIFTDSGPSITPYYGPRSVAIDGSGNAWVLSPNSNSVYRYSPLGVPAGPFTSSSCPGLTGSMNTALPVSIAIDTANDVWVGLAQAQNEVCEFNSSGAYLNHFSLGGTDSSDNVGPQDMAFDGSGNLWIADNEANSESGSLVEVANSTHTITSYSSNGLNFPFGIAIEPASQTGNIWVANCDCELNGNNGSNDGDSVFTATGGNAAISPATAGSIDAATGAAIDASGNVWSLSYLGASKTPDSGSTSGAGFFEFSNTDNLISVAIDGSSNVWMVNYDYTSAGYGPYFTLVELNNAGSALSPTAGFKPIGTSTNNFAEVPINLAIDGSGDVWYTMSNGSMRELIGAATPVATPLAYGVTNKLGATP